VDEKDDNRQKPEFQQRDAEQVPEVETQFDVGVAEADHLRDDPRKHGEDDVEELDRHHGEELRKIAQPVRNREGIVKLVGLMIPFSPNDKTAEEDGEWNHVDPDMHALIQKP